MNDGRRFYGKYRGKVTHNDDPDGLGRIQATVLEVYGKNDSPWAWPCVPYAGNGVGLMLLPPKGAWVWMEFEHGKPDVPIWSGCFWETGQAPKPQTIPTNPALKLLKTDSVTISIDDQNPGQGSIVIQTAAKASLTIQGNTITLDNAGQPTAAKVDMSGNKVSVNNGDLEVT
jgi:uncharacterized protein involved in type VI secretion and phage assembly